MEKSNEKNYLEAKNELYLGNFEKAADMFRRKFPRDNILLIYDRNFKWSNSIYVSI